VTGRRRRRCKQLLDGLKEKIRGWIWKRKHWIALSGESAVEGTVGRAGRKTAYWMDEWTNGLVSLKGRLVGKFGKTLWSAAYVYCGDWLLRYTEHCGVQHIFTVVTGCYCIRNIMEWPLYGTYSDHCTVHIVTTTPRSFEATQYKDLTVFHSQLYGNARPLRHSCVRSSKLSTPQSPAPQPCPLHTDNK
jgi:hypothetical protein